MAEKKQRTIFLVDDDASHNEMLKNHLNAQMNVKITTFSTGEDCLRNIDQNPNVVILDYNLNSDDKSAQNGIQILKKIKEANVDTEVIMLSGQDKIDVAVETMKNGAFDYVIKNESAFMRAQNTALNVFKSLKLQENLKAYKFATYFLLAVIALIIVVAFVLVATGVAKESPGWL